MEQNLQNEAKLQLNLKTNDIFKKISKVIKIRSRCNWYELGEKSNKYFLNLEKNWACQSILRKICSEPQEITGFTKINSAINDFYSNLFKVKVETNSKSLNNFLKDISILSLSETQKQVCEEELTKKDIYEFIISFDKQ